MESMWVPACAWVRSRYTPVLSTELVGLSLLAMSASRRGFAVLFLVNPARDRIHFLRNKCRRAVAADISWMGELQRESLHSLGGADW